MKVTRARIVPVLLLALAGVGVIAVQSPAHAVGVTTTTITTPADDNSYFLADTGPFPTFNVAGTSDGTTGDQVDIRCYTIGSSDWTMSYTADVQANGSFARTVPINGPYGTCKLLAVPHNYPLGASLTGFTGHLVTTEYQWTKYHDYSVAYQGSKALFDITSATSGGYWDSRLNYPDGSSSNYLWDSRAAALPAEKSESRSRIQIDGRNAYGPFSASDQHLGGAIPGAPKLTLSSISRDNATGLTRFTEKNPLVRCPVGTAYPATPANCSKFFTTGIRLERSYVVADGGRQVHVTDVWRSTDGRSHTISARYVEEVHGYDYVAGSDTDVALKLPWLGGTQGVMFHTFSGPASYTGPTQLANTIYLRDSNTAPDGDTTLPRGALTFDFPATVQRTAYDTFNLNAKSFTVPAGGSRKIRQSFVMDTTDAEVLAKAKSNRTRINPYRADAQIKRSGAASFKGNNVYNSTGAGQEACCGKSFLIAIQNDGSRTDSFRIKGASSMNGFGVKYLAGTTGNTNITYAVTHGTYVKHYLAPGARSYIRLVLTLPSPDGQSARFPITATSLGNTFVKDVVRAYVQMGIS